MTLKHTDHRQPQMHKWFPLIALLLLVLASPVWADYTVDFVRISCVPDAQFLDVEYRGIHNPAITALTEHGTVRPDVLARHGFFRQANSPTNAHCPTRSTRSSLLKLAGVNGECVGLHQRSS